MCSADSGSQSQAEIALARQRAAATKPGAEAPQTTVSVAIPGPIMTPALVAAVNQPRAFDRSFGSTASVTYACTTPTVPPPAPWISRESSSIQMLWASPKTM